MPHMANLPWLSLYILIALLLTLFWTKENFSFCSLAKQNQMIKITNKTLDWTW